MKKPITLSSRMASFHSSNVSVVNLMKRTLSSPHWSTIAASPENTSFTSALSNTSLKISTILVTKQSYTEQLSINIMLNLATEYNTSGDCLRFMTEHLITCQSPYHIVLIICPYSLSLKPISTHDFTEDRSIDYQTLTIKLKNKVITRKRHL